MVSVSNIRLGSRLGLFGTINKRLYFYSTNLVFTMNFDRVDVILGFFRASK